MDYREDIDVRRGLTRKQSAPGKFNKKSILNGTPYNKHNFSRQI